VGTKWFRERAGIQCYFKILISHITLQFKEGLRSIRSTQVHILADLCPGHIFQISQLVNLQTEKSSWTFLKSVTSWRTIDSSMIAQPTSTTEHLEGHMRNECILKVNYPQVYHHAILTNNDTVSPHRHCNVSFMAHRLSRTGQRVWKLGKVNGELWNCSTVNIPMLAYGATVVCHNFPSESALIYHFSGVFCSFGRTRIYRTKCKSWLSTILWYANQTPHKGVQERQTSSLPKTPRPFQPSPFSHWKWELGRTSQNGGWRTWATWCHWRWLGDEESDNHDDSDGIQEGNSTIWIYDVRCSTRNCVFPFYHVITGCFILETSITIFNVEAILMALWWQAARLASAYRTWLVVLHMLIAPSLLCYICLSHLACCVTCAYRT